MTECTGLEPHTPVNPECCECAEGSHCDGCYRERASRKTRRLTVSERALVDFILAAEPKAYPGNTAKHWLRDAQRLAKIIARLAPVEEPSHG